jgi:hypothetical protein
MLDALRSLWVAWDPINVYRFDWPLDEYDSYLQATLAALSEPGSRFERQRRVEAFLLHTLRKSFGEFEHDLPNFFPGVFAEILVDWHDDLSQCTAPQDHSVSEFEQRVLEARRKWRRLGVSNVDPAGTTACASSSTNPRGGLDPDPQKSQDNLSISTHLRSTKPE